MLMMALIALSAVASPLDSVRSYVYYRGEKYDKKLEKFDLVIARPDFPAKYVKRLHKKNVIVLASVEKTDSIDKYRFLTDEVGFDGFLFVLSPSDTAFLRSVRDEFKDKVIVVSTDVINIEPFLPYIDGFLWRFLSTELLNGRFAPRADRNRIRRDNYLAINIINRLRLRRKNFRAFALDVLTFMDSNAVRACYQRAARLDFVEYVGPPAFNIVVMPPESIKIDSAFAYNLDPIFKLPSQIVPDTSEENIALAINGAKAGYDSQAPGMDVRTVNDGFINDPGIAWLIPINWATGSDSSGHYLEIRFRDEFYLDSVKIYWPIVNGKPLSPKRYRLEAQSSERPFWWPMIVATDSRPRRMDRYVFTDAYAGRIRIYVAPGDGPEPYPFQLWVSEIKAYGE